MTQTLLTTFLFQRGLVHVDHDHYYLIHPLPKLFHNETSKPHILVRKNHMKSEDTSTSICPHSHHFEERSSRYSPASENDTVQQALVEDITKDYQTKVNFSNNGSSNLTRRKREAFPDGAPAFVETAVFVDRDLFEHMKTNYPVETERELIRFVLAMINAVSIINII